MSVYDRLLSLYRRARYDHRFSHRMSGAANITAFCTCGLGFGGATVGHMYRTAGVEPGEPRVSPPQGESGRARHEHDGKDKLN